MRLIFINRFFYPDHSATSQMLSDLAFGLAERGASVSVITSRLSYDDPAANRPARETIRGVQIERIWTSKFGRAGLALRLVDYLTFYVSAAWTLARLARRGDTVVAMTDPPALSIFVSLIAWLRGAVIVNWLQDIFPEVVEALQLAGTRSSLLLSPFRLARDASLRHASMNVAIGSLMAERLLRSGVTPSRIAVIPNWADTNAILPIRPERNALRSEWCLSDKFVVAYSGNLGRAHGITELLEAMTVAKGATGEPQPHWLFIGGGVGFEQLKRRANERGVSNMTFRPYQPREHLSQSLSVADVHLVLLRSELEGLIVPSKFYGIAAAGRPVMFVGAADGELARLIRRYDCGVAIAEGDGIGLARALSKLAQDLDRCSEMGERARAMCEKNFSKEQAIDRWLQLVEHVQEEAQVLRRTRPHNAAPFQR